MKIKSVTINQHKKEICIDTRKGVFQYPFVKLDIRPTSDDRISEIYIDKELGCEAVTYILESGKENSVHLDSFLEYNKDPDFLRMRFLFELTVEAKNVMKKSKLSKNEICRRLKTSPSQLSRLLDQTNHRKSVDKMLDLLAVLGVNVKPEFENAA